jgi:pimeloyl-ACP methyl ester carboxylesterase
MGSIVAGDPSVKRINRRRAFMSVAAVAAFCTGVARADDTPASTLKSLMPEVKRAKVNGIELAYYEAGPRRGPLIVLCHGFPEIAFTWWRQIKAWSEAGYWIVAPDQRGYGLSSRPTAVADYDQVHLTGDMVGLLDHLGVKSAIFCGHDMGLGVSWQMALRHPDRVAGVIGFGGGFGGRAANEPVAALTRTNGPDMYQVWFQTPGEADAFLAKDPNHSLRLSMRNPELGLLFRVRGPSGSAYSLRDRYLAAGGVPSDSDIVIPPEEMAVFVDSFRRTGFTGGINWYRNMTRNWQNSASLPKRIDGIPCLVMAAEMDSVGSPRLETLGNNLGNAETHLIKGSGHWIPQEKAPETTAIVLDWLGRHFPR